MASSRWCWFIVTGFDLVTFIPSATCCNSCFCSPSSHAVAPFAFQSLYPTRCLPFSHSSYLPKNSILHSSVTPLLLLKDFMVMMTSLPYNFLDLLLTCQNHNQILLSLLPTCSSENEWNLRESTWSRILILLFLNWNYEPTTNYISFRYTTWIMIFL